jgi:hypothetical protein
MNKRVGITVVAAILTGAAFGQFHGVPAGATSLSNTHTISNPPGVPAGATSITPRPFNSNPNIGRFVVQPVRERRDIHRTPRVVIAVPVPLYGYGYYPYLDPATDSSVEMNAADYRVDEAPVASYSPQPIVVAPVQQPAQVIVIDDRGVRDATSDEKEQALATSRAAKDAKPQAAAVAQPAPEPDDVGPMTVLVFRDGTRKEVKNYAIMGKELIVLGSGSLRRVQLADLDLPATTKENDGRGLDFRLP